GVEQRNWYLVEKVGGFGASQKWSQIAYSAHKSGLSSEIVELAKKISFSIRTSSLRLRDISFEYHRQLADAIIGEKEQSRVFSNVKIFDLYMAIHSALVEMCSARDYLAQFISEHILRISRCSTMAKLAQKLNSILSDEKVILQIREAYHSSSPNPWMAKLGRYRNLIVHQAPIANFSERFIRLLPSSKFLMTFLGIPKNPMTAKEREIRMPSKLPSGDFVDALTEIRSLLAELCYFANLAADASGIKPEIPTITDEHLFPAQSNK
nr:hypothetical protein [Xanthobacteraceae bacterium]